MTRATTHRHAVLFRLAARRDRWAVRAVAEEFERELRLIRKQDERARWRRCGAETVVAGETVTGREMKRLLARLHSVHRLAHAALYDLYADLRERYGREVPINVLTVRPATNGEIGSWRWHHETRARDAEWRAR